LARERNRAGHRFSLELNARDCNGRAQAHFGKGRRVYLVIITERDTLLAQDLLHGNRRRLKDAAVAIHEQDDASRRRRTRGKKKKQK